MINTTKYQKSINGPLNEKAISFLLQIKVGNKWSYKTLGEHLGVSGPFAHAILHKPSNITTSTAMQLIAQGIEKLEAGVMEVPRRQATERTSDGMLEHTYHLRSGVAVSFKLPEDITEREAQRLGMFINTLSQ